MDITISRNSFNEIIQKIPKLYDEALNKMQKNILIISPLIYALIDKTMIDHSNNIIQPIKVSGILVVHSVGYYIVHKSFHVITCLRKYHNFHHEFDYYMLPSIGNAVSTEEFLIAYISPFIIGAYIFEPNEISFVIPIALISIFNNIIHTDLKMPHSICFVEDKICFCDSMRGDFWYDSNKISSFLTKKIFAPVASAI